MTQRSRAPLIVAILGWLLGAILLTASVFVVMSWIASGDPWPWNRTLPSERPKLFEVVRSTTPIAGLLGASIAAVVAIRRQSVTEGTDERDAVSRLRSRYTTAAEQLGSNSPAIRLAGVYAMAALADDWLMRGQRNETQVCINVLCAYLRTPLELKTDADAAGDREVRQTVLRTILGQVCNEKRWSKFDFDFSNAHFDFNVSFAGAEFAGTRTDFSSVKFLGHSVDFSGAAFPGSRTYFSGAAFSGEKADFSHSQFSGDEANFSDCTFSSKLTYFGGARFILQDPESAGVANFSSAEFTGAVIDFTRVAFGGNAVDFSDSRFSELPREAQDHEGPASICVDFSGAQFFANLTDFRGANFRTDKTLFVKVAFSGDRTDFSNTSFWGMKTTFAGSTFSAGTTILPRASFAGRITEDAIGDTLSQALVARGEEGERPQSHMVADFTGVSWLNQWPPPWDATGSPICSA